MMQRKVEEETTFDGDKIRCEEKNTSLGQRDSAKRQKNTTLPLF